MVLRLKPASESPGRVRTQIAGPRPEFSICWPAMGPKNLLSYKSVGDADAVGWGTLLLLMCCYNPDAAFTTIAALCLSSSAWYFLWMYGHTSCSLIIIVFILCLFTIFSSLWLLEGANELILWTDLVGRLVLWMSD